MLVVGLGKNYVSVPSSMPSRLLGPKSDLRAIGPRVTLQRCRSAPGANNQAIGLRRDLLGRVLLW